MNASNVGICSSRRTHQSNQRLVMMKRTLDNQGGEIYVDVEEVWGSVYPLMGTEDGHTFSKVTHRFSIHYVSDQTLRQKGINALRWNRRIYHVAMMSSWTGEWTDILAQDRQEEIPCG